MGDIIRFPIERRQNNIDDELGEALIKLEAQHQRGIITLEEFTQQVTVLIEKGLEW